jgi:hypothetical protein
VRSLLPAPLEPVTHGGFAFWNVVVCEVTDLRPSLFPAVLGLAYWHVGYRLHVQVRLANGATLAGLHFVRSDCDRRIVAAAGNLLTDFRFHTARIRIEEGHEQVVGTVRAPGANVDFRLRRGAMPQPAPVSPFLDIPTAQKALKYPPRGLSPEQGGEAVNAVHIVRDESAWRSEPIAMEEAQWEFFKERDAHFELCCEVAPIAYEWRRGEVLRVAP